METMTAIQPKSRTGGLGQVLRYGICLLVAALVVIPLLVSVFGGFKNNKDLLAHPFSWPSPFVTKNYTDILGAPDFWRQALNSLLVMFGTTFLVLALASSTAFVFARMPFRGRDVVATFFTLGLLFPATIAILPLYILVRRIGLVDSLWGIILPQVAFALPVSILILRNYFISIPREIEDAAYVDGASAFEFYWRM